MNRLETYRNFYEKEIERRNQLNNELSIPIALVSGLSTGVFFYVSNFDFSGNKTVSIIICGLITLGTLFLLRAMFFLLRSYLLLAKSVTYDYLAYPSEINKYFDDYKHYYLTFLNKPEDEAIKLANENLEVYFIEGYLRTSTKNIRINDERSANLFRCKQQILFSLVFLLAAFIPYIINFFQK